MGESVCPLWVGYLLASPIRKLFQNPEKILAPYVRQGMMVLDAGCAMGFFSLPLARMVGPGGKVICSDVQEKMIQSLEKRAEKAGMSGRIETRICHQNTLGLDDVGGKIDFALAFAVVHEVSDARAFFSEIHDVLRPLGKLLVAEPAGHVSEKAFEAAISVAEQNGFKVGDGPQIAFSHTVLLEKEMLIAAHP